MRPRSRATGAVSATLVPSHLLAFLGRSGVESSLTQRKVTRWSPCNLAVTCYGSSSATGWVVVPRIRQETCNASWSVRPTSTEEAEMISAVLERQREPPRSLRGSGAARSGLRGRGLGGRHRPPPPTPLASHLRHFPRAPGRGHPRCPATDGSLERRHDHEVPAPVRRGPTCRHRPGVPGELRPPRSPFLKKRFLSRSLRRSRSPLFQEVSRFGL